MYSWKIEGKLTLRLLGYVNPFAEEQVAMKGPEEGASLNCFQYTSRVGRVPGMCTSLNGESGSFLLSLRVIMVVLIVSALFLETP